RVGRRRDGRDHRAVMNVGLVTTSFPRHAGDYAGSFVADRVQRLLADGDAVEVIAAGDGGGAREIEHERLTVTRIKEGDLFYGGGAPEALERGGAEVWFAAARFTVALAAAIRARAHRLDVVESHWLVPSALAAVAAAPGCRQRAFAHSGDVALLE